jgi:hypothetical protein
MKYLLQKLGCKSHSMRIYGMLFCVLRGLHRRLCSQPCLTKPLCTAMSSKQLTVRMKPTSHEVVDACSQGPGKTLVNFARNVALSELHRGTAWTPPRRACTSLDLCATPPVSNRMTSLQASHLVHLCHSPVSIANPSQPNWVLHPSWHLIKAAPTPPHLHIHALHQEQMMQEFPRQAKLTM